MRSLVGVAWVAGLLLSVMAKGAEPAALEGRVSLSGAWALYPMAVRWGEEFQKLHPRVCFDISAGGAGKGITDTLSGAVDIGLVSRDISAAEVAKGALAIAVTRDAVIPMVNARNPVLADLQRQGVTREVFAGVWIGKSVTRWNQIAGGKAVPIRVYTRSDACGAAETWARYLGRKQEDLGGIGVYGDPGLGEAVRKDVLGIGFNNVNYAYDAKTGKPVAGLAVVPLDVNGNGTLDANEDFYATQKDLMAAIARGDFPSPPARDLYFVCKGRPANPTARAFVRWVLTDGQRFVPEAGYIELPGETLAAGLRALQDDAGDGKAAP